MSDLPAAPRRWLVRRWWSFVVLVFFTQLGLIFWLGKAARPAAPHRDVAPSLQFAAPNMAERLALNDPTLFALPHEVSFSGLAWLTQEFHPFLSPEPPPFLPLPQPRLARDFEAFMATNELAGLPEIAQPDLKFKVPSVQPAEPLVRQSTLRLMGEFAGRRLLNSPGLPPWTNAEMLSNSIVQLLVDANGRPVSATLLKPPGNASTEADQYALREARRARFEPINSADPRNPMAGLSLGQMVFEWRTLPLPSTNTPAESPTIPH
ncbi:MAG TPA: energy transducer TonB [Verrucomicrobiae bacterium]|nr:energy transducer TonB [Verrucomicrobiae bacterium]